MIELVDIVEFTSPRFSPRLSEEAQVNPETYGAELAWWLCLELAGLDIDTSYPESEDWGWYISHTSETGSEFAVHCGNIRDTKDRWLLSLRTLSRGLFKPKVAPSEARRLVEAIEKVVRAEGSASGINWMWGSSVDA